MAHMPCHTPVLLQGCGFQGLTWICLMPITQKGSSQSFCPPSYDLTSNFSSSELTLPCQPLPCRHPGRNGPGPISGLPANVSTS